MIRSRQLVLSVLALSLLLCLADSSYAQGEHEFLGGARQVPDQISPRFGIRYNTQGFDEPKAKWNKKVKKWNKKGVPESIVEEILAFPGSPDAFGKWIDDAFEQTRLEFNQCGGVLAQRANEVSPDKLYITIMPTAFYEPHWKIYLAGAYYPSTHDIKVLNIYYIWDGPNKGWLRHARDLLKWEIGNYFAMESKVQPEPRIAGWPCSAPPLK